MKEWINDYRIIDIIGQGAFAKVYHVKGLDQKEYALKMIEVNQQNKQKIREEGILLASMKHENLLWAREFFFYQKEKYFMIITDFCAEGSLDRKIGHLHEGSLVKIMAGIANGLRYLHVEKSIVHRDLKPQNILLDGDTPKIADFGIAKELRTQRASTNFGTPWYMAFEMLEGDYDIAVDIWALGIIYLELLVGKRIMQLLKGAQTPAKRASFPSPELLNKIKDEKYRKMISSMLKKKPEERIDIQEVCNNFQFLSPLKRSKTFRIKSVDVDYELICEIYAKFKDYIWCKLNFKSLRQLLVKNVLQIDSQASKDNRKAQFLLGYLYQHGIGIPANKAQAQKWYLRAYSHEQPHCCYELHLLTESERQKKQYLYNGSRLEEVRCKLKIAQNFAEELDGFAFDLQEAFDAALQLTDKNYPLAFRLIAKIRSKSNTEYFNLEEALKDFKVGAELGDINSRICLVQELYKQKMYTQVIKQSIALQTYEELSNPYKLLGLQLRAKSHAKNKQFEKAIQCVKRCIELDSGELEKDYIGQMARLVELMGNKIQAIKYYKDAIFAIMPKREKSEYFQTRLKKLCEQVYSLLVEQHDYEQAFTIADLSATLGHQNGKADMAYMLYTGLGVQMDKQKGLDSLLKLSEQGNEEAKSYMKDIVTKME